LKVKRNCKKERKSSVYAVLYHRTRGYEQDTNSYKIHEVNSKYSPQIKKYRIPKKWKSNEGLINGTMALRTALKYGSTERRILGSRRKRRNDQ
jgi:hypothetical protein